MNHSQLNQYIKHYMEEDKTKSAIMLTAPWGTGKSYYTEEILRPFLEDKCNKRCVVVSLYGLSSIEEVSRSLYMEMAFKKISKSSKLWQKKKTSKAASSGRAVGKTIAKSISISLETKLAISPNDFENIYKVVDFKEFLIVFEDLERTQIPILDFLGYVNNLVEQDKIKVLLVANEDEIFQYQNQEGKLVFEKDFEKDPFFEGFKETVTSKRTGLELTETTKQYIRTKEKTISDTLTYEGDCKTAIKNIISQFSNTYLEMCKKEENIIEIVDIFDRLKQSNLRSFLFACQKTSDIYKFISKEYDSDFVKAIFFGNIIFIMKTRRGDTLKWNEESRLSYLLGNAEYPLFKFCYNYITAHTFQESEVDITYKEFQDARLYNMSKSNTDKDISTIWSFETKKEVDVRQAIMNVERRLRDDVADISFGLYGILASYLIYLTEYIDCDISNCLNLLVENLKGRGGKILEHHLFRHAIELENEKKKQEFLKQREAMILALNTAETSFLNFDYAPETIPDFCEKVYSEKARILEKRSFFKNLNVNEFADMIFCCSSEEISLLRRMFNHIYGASNIRDYLAADKKPLSQLVELLGQHQNPKEFDGIQIMQKDYLISNLKQYIDNLS